jgi:hypothetical protein
LKELFEAMKKNDLIKERKYVLKMFPNSFLGKKIRNSHH